MTTATEAWQAAEGVRGWYLDASALVKVYLPEPESVALDGALENRDDVIVSELAITETVAACARRRREKRLTANALAEIHRTILSDREGGVFQLVDLSPETHRAAERILASSTEIPLRAADALHLAQAIAADAAVIVTFDTRLARAATAAGLTVLPQVA